MAGTSMKDIRLRIKSVQSTMQITKAMQLVASSKLRQARARMEASRPYLEIARDTVADIARHNTGCDSPYLNGRDVRKRCLVVVAGDRGLAGSYNANVFKLIRAELEATPYCALSIGRKAGEYFHYQGAELLPFGSEKAEGLTMDTCREMAKGLIERYDAGEIDEIDLVYTSFQSILTQNARWERLLPVSVGAASRAARQMLFEPSPEELLAKAIPDYLAGMIYAAACDSVASEQAARRVAMDAATKNAGEMIDDLNLRYNRARQASITQELTEIVAGAEGENEGN